jgi:hypothetical protein
MKGVISCGKTAINCGAGNCVASDGGGTRTSEHVLVRMGPLLEPKLQPLIRVGASPATPPGLGMGEGK